MAGVQTEQRLQRLAQAAQVGDLMADRAQQLELELARLEQQRPLLVLVPCGSAKLAHPAPAGELYTGSLHRAAQRAAAAIVANEGARARVMVLSALHGLLELEQLVAPYNVTVGDPDAITGPELLAQVVQLELAGADVIVLGGSRYVGLARCAWPEAVAPLEGCAGMGYMLQRLTMMATDGYPSRLAQLRSNLGASVAAYTDLRS